MKSIDRAFQDHAASIAAGYAAMGATPELQPFTNPNQMHTTTPTPPPAEIIESTSARVIREAGLIGKFDLLSQIPANIEPHTTAMLTKAERTEVLDLSNALERLAAEVAKADDIAINPQKIALAWAEANPGQIIPHDLVERGAMGAELRTFARRAAKSACSVFWKASCEAKALEIFAKAAEVLGGVIVKRVEAERQAFTKFAEVFHDDEDQATYRPSQALLRLLSRHRQLLDGEVAPTSPQSLKSALQGVYAI